jgi:hypothetical protein
MSRLIANGATALRTAHPDAVVYTVSIWTEAHPRVETHYTPTYSSRLSQVEIWFARIDRGMIARGIFTSTADIRRKLIQYIR